MCCRRLCLKLAGGGAVEFIVVVGGVSRLSVFNLLMARYVRNKVFDF